MGTDFSQSDTMDLNKKSNSEQANVQTLLSGPKRFKKTKTRILLGRFLDVELLGHGPRFKSGTFTL